LSYDGNLPAPDADEAAICMNRRFPDLHAFSLIYFSISGLIRG